MSIDYKNISNFIEWCYNNISSRIGSDFMRSKARKKSNNNIKIFGYMVICFIVSCIVSYVGCVLLSPKIQIDRKDITLNYGEEWREPSVRAFLKNKDISDQIKKSGSVDDKILGDYSIEYDVSYSIFQDKKIVNIHVVDKEAPQITLTGGVDIKICPNQEYKELGYSAIDNYDGDITNKVVVEQREDKFIYDVYDSSKNKSSITRNIIRGDSDMPVITLNDSENMVIYTGNSYREPGYKAIDNCDGDITNKVTVSGDVNSSVPGTYKITYYVKDNAGNETSKIRTVVVKNWNIIRPSGGGNGRGIVYLTFDDGPNEGTTNVILDVLKSEGVPATFFVTCNGPDYLIKRMHDEGHTVALHTATHNYNYVYASVNNYFQDLERVSNRVERITGEKSMIIRFPGGSSNTISKRISPGIMSTLTSEVKRRGYHYFDWNVDSNDAGGASSNGVYSNVINGLSFSRENVVLMHDVKLTTRDAIRNIIRTIKNNGYTFRRITYDTVMVTHGVNN